MCLHFYSTYDSKRRNMLSIIIIYTSFFPSFFLFICYYGSMAKRVHIIIMGWAGIDHPEITDEIVGLD